MKNTRKQIIRTKTLIPLTFLFLTLLFFTSTASASSDVIYVNTTGNDTTGTGTIDNPYLTIQTGYDNLNPEGTIYLADGQYNGANNTQITINKNLTITGQSQENTIIDGKYTNWIFNIQQGINVTLENLTLTNGYTADNGGAICNYGNLTITNCTLQSNHAEDYGGAIYNYNGNSGSLACTITGSTFLYNKSDFYGGAIFNDDYHGDSLNCTITKTTFYGNRALGGDGGAIENYNYGGSLICTVTDSVFLWNQSTLYGGAIDNYSSSTGSLNCTVTDSYFELNSANYIGGAINNLRENGGSVNCTVTESTFKNNTSRQGGAIGNFADYGNYVTCTANFNRFIIAVACNAIYCNNASVDAENNWWGTNNPDTNWSQFLKGVTTPTMWVLLTIDASPDVLCVGETSTVTANLNYNNKGENLLTTYVKSIPSVAVLFNVDSLGTLSTYDGAISEGNNASTTFTAGQTSGTSKVQATVDNATVDKTITILIPTSLVVNNVSGYTGDTVDLTATLSDSSGSPLDGKEITFTVNGVDYSATTGVDGVATVSYLIGLTSGQYPIKATFDGDSDYKSSENTGTLTVDNEAPFIVSTDPVNGATRVSPNKTITVTFNEDIIGGTQWIELVNSTGEAIPFAMSISDNVLTITPYNDLAEAAYKLILHTGCVTDLAGNPLAVTNFKFTVGTAPTITATSPLNGATNVPASKTITVTFSEAIRKSSNFWVELVNTTTGADVDYTSYITGGNMLVISPVDDLAEASYKVILHTGCVTDLAGNPLAVTNFSFTVGTAPTITATSPVDGATNVNVAKTITVTFDEAIRKSSNFWVELVNTTTGDEIAFTSYITGGNMLVINPTADLAANTTYKVILHTGCVTDLAGNPLKVKSFSFTTRST